MSHTDPQPTLTPKAAPREEEGLEGLPFGEATRRKPHSGEVDTPLCVYGSKRVHIDKLLAIVPKHSFYTEPFFTPEDTPATSKNLNVNHG